MVSKHKLKLKCITLVLIALALSLSINIKTIYADDDGYVGDGSNTNAEINEAKIKGQYPSYCKTGYLVYMIVVNGNSASIVSNSYVSCHTHVIKIKIESLS